MIRKIKNTVPWTCVTEDLNGKEIVEMFYENELRKTNQTDFRTDKVIKKKADKSSGNVMMICLIAGLIKRISLYEISYY